MSGKRTWYADEMRSASHQRRWKPTVAIIRPWKISLSSTSRGWDSWESEWIERPNSGTANNIWICSNDRSVSYRRDDSQKGATAKPGIWKCDSPQTPHTRSIKNLDWMKAAVKSTAAFLCLRANRRSTFRSVRAMAFSFFRLDPNLIKTRIFSPQVIFNFFRDSPCFIKFWVAIDSFFCHIIPGTFRFDFRFWYHVFPRDEIPPDFWNEFTDFKSPYFFPFGFVSYLRFTSLTRPLASQFFTVVRVLFVIFSHFDPFPFRTFKSSGWSLDQIRSD